MCTLMMTQYHTPATESIGLEFARRVPGRAHLTAAGRKGAAALAAVRMARTITQSCGAVLTGDSFARNLLSVIVRTHFHQPSFAHSKRAALPSCFPLTRRLGSLGCTPARGLQAATVNIRFSSFLI